MARLACRGRLGANGAFAQTQRSRDVVVSLAIAVGPVASQQTPFTPTPQVRDVLDDLLVAGLRLGG